MYYCLTKRKNKMGNLQEKVESAVIREEISTRGGGVEIDLGVFDDVWDGELMSAYQNYLGGGMLGSIQNDCSITQLANRTNISYHSLYNTYRKTKQKLIKKVIE